jgi:hypothetical protein
LAWLGFVLLGLAWLANSCPEQYVQCVNNKASKDADTKAWLGLALHNSYPDKDECKY